MQKMPCNAMLDAHAAEPMLQTSLNILKYMLQTMLKTHALKTNTETHANCAENHMLREELCRDHGSINNK
jgi:hypothetical protein